MDIDLRDKLKCELSGILNWVIEGYRRLKSKDFKLQETRSVEHLKHEYRQDKR